ncbi:MAG: response regulator [Candidatus Heimdallarchaeota archaeon]|nr:response regulator [Candidatus Heimdallarchaeota archaeon]
MKVLIVDDSLLANHALKSYFDKLGHEIVGLAKSGEEAKTMLHETTPDIVTVDSVMPGISGTELIQFINQNDSEYVGSQKSQKKAGI